jgi:hypothetical protein
MLIPELSAIHWTWRSLSFYLTKQSPNSSSSLKIFILVNSDYKQRGNEKYPSNNVTADKGTATVKNALYTRQYLLNT